MCRSKTSQLIRHTHTRTCPRITEQETRAKTYQKKLRPILTHAYVLRADLLCTRVHAVQRALRPVRRARQSGLGLPRQAGKPPLPPRLPSVCVCVYVNIRFHSLCSTKLRVKILHVRFFDLFSIFVTRVACTEYAEVFPLR